MREGPQCILDGDVELRCNARAIQCPLKERHIAVMLTSRLLHYSSRLLILAACMCLGTVIVLILICSQGIMPEPCLRLYVWHHPCDSQDDI